MPAFFSKFLASKSSFIKKLTACLGCIAVLALLTQAGNAEDDKRSASEIADLRKKAEQGDAKAQYRWGLEAQDEYEAAKWYRKAADQGYSKAQLHLGLAHWFGRGVISDKKKACDLIRAAAEQEDGDRFAIEFYNKHCVK